jgi:hypothetical protein
MLYKNNNNIKYLKKDNKIYKKYNKIYVRYSALFKINCEKFNSKAF